MKNIRCAAAELAQIPALLTLVFITAFTTTSVAQLPSITSFKFEVQHNTGKITDDIVADIYGDSIIVGLVPYQQAEFNLAPTFITNGETVTVNDVEQQSTITSNDFSSVVTYVVSSGANTRSYKVKLIATGLPLVYIYTQDAAPILNKEDYVAGNMKIYPAEEAAAEFSSAMQIRGRGNTTWTLPKKPYRIKLASAASILGMPSDKDWLLLANHSDKTLMRNSLAYYLGSHMNFEYTPRTTHVDLILNGVYQGNYLFGEHIKVDKDRVDIEELKEEDIGDDVITGGYFLELDDYRDGLYFELGSGLPFVIKDPEDLPQEQLDYIKNYMQTTEDVILSDDFADPDIGYAKYIDTETFIEWYWVMEVLKNIDAKDVSSIFYYKDRGEKLKMGPLWDLDVAAGNASVYTGDDPTSFYVRESIWFKRLFEDPAFKAAAEARWATLKHELLSTLPDVIDDYAERLQASQQQNFYKWNVLNQIVWPSPLALGSYKNEVDYLKKWMTTRIAWIDAQITQPEFTAFSLTAPADQTRVFLSPGDDGEITFSWKASTAGSAYVVRVDKQDGDFTNPVATYNANFFTMDTTATIPLSTLRELFGEIEAEDSVTLKWTAVALQGENESMAESFTINLVSGNIGKPKLHSPSANETVDNLQPAIKWFKAHLADGYELQVSSSTDFGTLLVNETGLSDTTYTITEALAEQTTYYWRARAVNATEQSDWSEVWSFSTPLISGIGENTFGVSMFPNPTNGDLFIEIPQYSSIENAEIVDGMGRTAFRSDLMPGVTTRIDVSTLQRGIYVVILRGKIDTPVTSKIVLR